MQRKGNATKWIKDRNGTTWRTWNRRKGNGKRWTRNDTEHAKVGKIDEFVATRKREVRQYVRLFVFVVIPYCWKLLGSNLKYTLNLSNPDPSLLANETTCSNSLTFFNYSSNLLSVFPHLPCTLMQFAYPTVPTLKMLSRNLLCVEWLIGLNVNIRSTLCFFPWMCVAGSVKLHTTKYLAAFSSVWQVKTYISWFHAKKGECNKMDQRSKWYNLENMKQEEGQWIKMNTKWYQTRKNRKSIRICSHEKERSTSVCQTFCFCCDTLLLEVALK